MNGNPSNSVSESSNTSSKGGLGRFSGKWMLPVAGILLAVALGWFFLRLLDPEPWLGTPARGFDYDPGPVQLALSPEAVAARQSEIVGLGSRFSGQPGEERARDLVHAEFLEAGLKVFEHDIMTPVPRTAYRKIYLVEPNNNGETTDQLLEDVEIFPFMPNFLQPVVTPEDGITGKLILLTSEVLRTRENFTDCIGLIDSREGAVDPDYGFAWFRYAQLGLKAVIVSHREGIDEAPWHQVANQQNGMVSSVPVNYVRLAASKEIFNYLDRTIKVRVRVDYVNTETKTLIGVMHAPEKARKAILLVAPYDACSILPDRASSSIQALKPAILLQFLEGLKAYRHSLRRDVMFISYGSSVMAEDGVNQLLRVIQGKGRSGNENPLLNALGLENTDQPQSNGSNELRIRAREHEEQAAMIKQFISGLDSPAFFVDEEETKRILASLSGETRKKFHEQFAYVLNTLVFELSEPLLQTKLDFENRAKGDIESEAFLIYRKTKKAYESAVAAAGYQPVSLLKSKAIFIRQHRIRERLKERFSELLAHHNRILAQIGQEVEISRLFDSYQQIAVFQTNLVPAFSPSDQAESIGLDTSTEITGTSVSSMIGLLFSSAERLGFGKRLKVIERTPARANLIGENIGNAPNSSTAMWTKFGYPTFTITSLQRLESFRRYTSPANQSFTRDIASLRFTLSALGETLLSVAHGNGRLDPFLSTYYNTKTFGGKVLVSNVGPSVVPNYPLKNALVAGGRSILREESFSFPGFYQHPLIFTDVYGRYELLHNASDFPLFQTAWGTGHGPLAVGFGKDGQIAYMKDEGEDGQRLFKSIHLSMSNQETVGNVTMITFRAMPLTVLDLTNPHTYKDFTAIKIVRREGLVPFPKQCVFEEGTGLHTTYLEPDTYAYVLLQSGEPGNELVKITRAFLLGESAEGSLLNEREIDGLGYLVADHSFLYNIPGEAAKSMARVNGRRLDLQNRYAMADERTNNYQEKTLFHLDESRQPGLPKKLAKVISRDAASYAMLNHPVLRQSVTEAVMGIIWYLGILVPFVFFLEKLLFCNSDVRKQLMAQGVIFLITFALLRLMHPAFTMVRSSLMILLGFVIILITSGITILVSGRFQENLEEIRRMQGKVSGAEVNTLAVTGSAFSLGLNNMNRRKMRTGLTCATLTLLTFAMICFSTSQNDLTDERIAVGKAPYQGMLIKRERFEPLSSAEVFALREEYGLKYDISPRLMFIGKFNPFENKRFNPELTIAHMVDGKTRRVSFDSALQWGHREPLQNRLKFLTRGEWFKPGDDRDSKEPCPVYIPDVMAVKLGLDPNEVNSGHTQVTINGLPFIVKGIFSAESLDVLRDLDGLNVRPFDIEAMSEIVEPQQGASLARVLAADDDPRIPAEKIVIFPLRNVFTAVPNGTLITVSLAVSMPESNFAEAETVIRRYMERTGERTFFGLDNMAFRGQITREFSVSASIDLLIPFLIAVLTVLQTMKGSVYERREEIYVYNSVGIAPRYVFFIFIAEALVYAIVGSMLGFLLSQGTGRILTELDLTGGLNMTFTNRSTVFASFAIIAATLLSTYFPAKAAAEIAIPAEDAGWSIPEPKDDVLSFELPFTFGPHDRVAVLAFFSRYLAEHAEGGSGRFASSLPQMNISPNPDDHYPDDFIPRVESTIWLRPFDLAVSQEMTISVPPDPATSQFLAVIELHRLSGTQKSWMRLNKGFVKLIRRQFLHWRIVTPDERERLFEEAKGMLLGA